MFPVAALNLLGLLLAVGVEMLMDPAAPRPAVGAVVFPSFVVFLLLSELGRCGGVCVRVRACARVPGRRAGRRLLAEGSHLRPLGPPEFS